MLRKNVVNQIPSKYYFIISLAFILLAIFRPDTMADYPDYKFFFESSVDSRFEPGFLLIRSIARYFSNPLLVGFAICALLSIPLRLFSIHKFSSWPLGSILVYITFVLVYHDMITIRAAISSSLLPFVLYSKISRNYKLFILSILAAILFHQSAFIFIVFLLISEKNPHRYLYVGILALSYILALYGIRFGYLIGYISADSVSSLFLENYQSNTANIFNLVQMGHILICISGWYIIRNFESNPLELLMLKCYTIGLCLVALLSDYLVIAYRFSQLLTVVEILLVPFIFKSLFKNETIAKSVLLVYSIIVFYFSITSIEYWSPYL